MREKAKELFEMPLRYGDLDILESLEDVNGANMTVEQAVILKQMQSAMKGNTDAAMFLQAVIGEEEEESTETDITDAAAEGDTLKMLKATRSKIAAQLDRATSPREIPALTRQLLEVNDRIEKIEKNMRNKQGDNVLNLVRNRSAQKRGAKVVNL